MWYAKTIGPYDLDSTEAKANMTEIKNYLMGQGWTLNACCGVMGNIGNEGGYNPWRWQDDIVLTRQQSAEDFGWEHGYGLYGYTPSNKYINALSAGYSGYGPNFADYSGIATDGLAQTIWMTIHTDQFGPATYSPYQNWTEMSDYISSTLNVQFLAELWMYNWEKPNQYWGEMSLPERKRHAQFWWDYFEGGPTPPTPPTPKPLKLKKFKWWMYMPPPRPMPF